MAKIPKVKIYSFTTKNYFLGLLLLLLGIILTIFFIFAGFTILAIILVIAVILYLVFGVVYALNRLFKPLKRK